MILVNPGQDTEFAQGFCLRLDNLSHHNHELIVINCASEHWGASGFIMQMHDDLQARGFDFWILTHHPGDHLVKPRVIFYPWWYYHGMKTFENIDMVAPRSKKLGCLHGNPRPHRIANYLALKNKFNPHDLVMSIFSTKNTPLRADDVELVENEHLQWQLIESSLVDRKHQVSDATIKIPALDDAYVHLTSETTVIDRIFMSEKTWKPIAAGQLFLYFGNPGTVGFLRTLGVDTFDDLIDHDSYDTVTDWRRRMYLVHELAHHLVELDLEDIWHATRSRRQANASRFFAGDFLQNYRHSVLDKALGNDVSLC